MENRNFEYAGWKANGFLALFLMLAGLAASVAIIVMGAYALEWSSLAGGLEIGLGVVGITLSLICCGGFILLEPNEARVLLFSASTAVISSIRAIGGSIPSCRPRISRSGPAT